MVGVAEVGGGAEPARPRAPRAICPPREASCRRRTLCDERGCVFHGIRPLLHQHPTSCSTSIRTGASSSRSGTSRQPRPNNATSTSSMRLPWPQGLKPTSLRQIRGGSSRAGPDPRRGPPQCALAGLGTALAGHPWRARREQAAPSPEFAAVTGGPPLAPASSRPPNRQRCNRKDRPRAPRLNHHGELQERALS
jgi:hypothetical protein